ncbi:hypothetical protein M407DRAFT_157771 [Tulasnella calospora MUT 4182]|uniref:Uncharacterized protein n=1 Tax=Tulasnella calospora MUT 4182 TaxID=1051891 RepID=A0A0C3Q540_9AGAM|nr:hypothetical protein M407DRAFT_157771 [Tulasnella calospora MUT 4182]
MFVPPTLACIHTYIFSCQMDRSMNGTPRETALLYRSVSAASNYKSKNTPLQAKQGHDVKQRVYT